MKDKICKICGNNESKKWLSGPICKKCYSKQSYIKNKNKIQSVQKKWKLNNIERVKNIQRKWEIANPDARKAANAKWRNKLTSKKKRYKSNKQWYENNKEYHNKYIKNKRLNDENFRIKVNLRSRLSQAVKNGQKSGSAIKDLDCSIFYLKRHLEAQFQPGMTWGNYGLYGWHIDHIIPLFNFDLSNSKEFKKACHYTNLQPLWAKDNLSKNGHTDKL